MDYITIYIIIIALVSSGMYIGFRKGMEYQQKLTLKNTTDNKLFDMQIADIMTKPVMNDLEIYSPYDGKVLKYLKNPRDFVKINEPIAICELYEVHKRTVTIKAPKAGIYYPIHNRLDKTVKRYNPICAVRIFTYPDKKED